MENLFLHTLNELEGYLGYLLTDKSGSHALRTLLVVLSGEPLAPSSSKTLLHSKRKEHITVNGHERNGEASTETRVVPDSFVAALEKVIDGSVSGLETNYLRALATHPVGNPTLQLLLKLELTRFGKQRAKDEKSIIHKLLPDDPIAEGTTSASFVNGLVYDAVGSRLLEAILEFAPAKLFKALYRQFFKERMGSLARNEIAGYVVCKVLERLSKDDLEQAMETILPQIHGLVERNRLTVIKTLVERCAAREASTILLAEALEAAYGGPNQFNISRLLKLGEATPDLSPEPVKDTKAPQAQPEKLHGSLLAQAMIAVQGPLSSLIFDSLIRLGPPLVLKVAKDPTASRTIQAALASQNASIIFRRKMIQQFYGHIGELALDPAASHVIDSIWEGTHGLAFIRERIAEELAENEAALRQSTVGRAVWRNWKMDLYKRRRADWVTQSRKNAGNDGFQPFPEDEKPEKSEPRKYKRAIDLAREKHATQARGGSRRRGNRRQKEETEEHQRQPSATPIAPI